MRRNRLRIALILSIGFLLLALITACRAFPSEPTPTIEPTHTETLPPTLTSTNLPTFTATPQPTETSQSVYETESAAQALSQTQTADYADWMYSQALLGFGNSPERIQMPQQNNVDETIYYFVAGNIYIVGFTDAYSRPTNLRAGGPSHSQVVLGDFYYMVELEFSSKCGSTPLGVFVREAARRYVLFAIRCSGQFSLTEVDKDADEAIYQWQTTDLISSDTNTLEVVSYRGLIRCYINGEFVAELTGIQEAGQLGVHMGAPGDEGAAMFRFLQYDLRTFNQNT